MSGQKRPADPSGPSFSGAPPEKRREREGEDGGPGVSAAAGGSTAVETVIKLGGVSNSVSLSLMYINVSLSLITESLFSLLYVFYRKSKTSKLFKLKTESWERLLIKDR